MSQISSLRNVRTLIHHSQIVNHELFPSSTYAIMARQDLLLRLDELVKSVEVDGLKKLAGPAILI